MYSTVSLFLILYSDIRYIIFFVVNMNLETEEQLRQRVTDLENKLSQS